MKQLALLVLFLVPLAQAQSPSGSLPTVEQCAADLHAWYPSRQTDAKNLHANQLVSRVAEMSACYGMAASSASQYKTLAADAQEYDTLTDTYQNSFTQRLIHFVQRHGQVDQFVKEDAAGKR